MATTSRKDTMTEYPNIIIPLVEIDGKWLRVIDVLNLSTIFWDPKEQKKNIPLILVEEK